MCSDTKEKIAEAVEQMMLTKPVSKITVQRVMEQAQMKRQTFYYHYQDIYSVLEWIVVREICTPLRYDESVSAEDWCMQALTLLRARQPLLRRISPALGHGRAAQHAEGHVAAQGGGHGLQLGIGQSGSVQLPQGQQRRGGVAAAAAQARLGRDTLFQRQGRAAGDACLPEKQRRGAVCQVLLPRRKRGIAARQGDALPGLLRRQRIAQADPLHDGYDLMIAVQALFPHRQR